MNLSNVLKASKGIPVDDFFDLLFAQSMGGGEQWETYEGTLPATINANGADMRQYQLWGNTGGVGDKTVNLFDIYSAEPNKFINPNNGAVTTALYNGYVLSDYIYVAGYNAVTISSVTGSVVKQTGAHINCYDNNKNWIRGYLAYNAQSANTQKNFVVDVTGISYIRVDFATADLSQNMLTSGTTTPETFVPFGYEVDIGVKSGNIYNIDETTWSANGTVLNDGGEPTVLEGSHYTTNFIPCKPGETYYLAGSLANETRWRVYFYDSNKNWIRRTGSKSPRGTRLVEMNENASYFQLQVGTDIVSTSDWNFVHSLTAPEKYQPYSNTTIPIYIGDDPLYEDEYVDYAKQKVYRMVDGTLTPTDPPVPLPALPTCDGTTVIDYEGQSVAPEKVLLEYKKGRN